LTHPIPASEPALLRIARWCAFGSAAPVLFSIAVSHSLLALSLAALLLSGAKLRLPRIWLPIAAWMLLTVLSVAMSDQPAAGIPALGSAGKRRLFSGEIWPDRLTG
jgi:hypothetical protein